MKSPTSPPSGQKRRKTSAVGSRTRKKQKRLDAICDRPEALSGTPSPYCKTAAEAPANEPETLRRSTRSRRAPVVLDSSPAPSHTRKGKRGRRGVRASGGKGGERGRSGSVAVDGKVKREIRFEEDAEKPVDTRGFSEEESSDWSLRLRSRGGKGGHLSPFAVGQGKLCHEQPVFVEVNGYAKPKEEAVENVASAASQTGSQESRRGGKLKEKNVAVLLLDAKAEEDSDDTGSAEEVAAAGPSSCHNNDEISMPEGEDETGIEVAVGEGRKVVCQEMVPGSQDGTTHEGSLLQEESKSTLAMCMPEDGGDTDGKTLLEADARDDRTDSPMDKIAAKVYVPEDRSIADEEALSDRLSKSGHVNATMLVGGNVMGHMLEDRRAACEQIYSETGLKVSTECGNKIAAEKKNMQKDEDEEVEEEPFEECRGTSSVKTSVDKENANVVNSTLAVGCEHQIALEATDQDREEQVTCVHRKRCNSHLSEGENMSNILHQSGDGLTGPCMGVHIDQLETRVPEGQNVPKQENSMQIHDIDAHGVPRVKEGRRCGLCGGGSDGKPPKKLILETVDSDNEHYNGSSSSEETNYDLWDGFGDEPEWLGRLLGPIRDRFGIARVWVHQQCAVWSPEVYFAGLGRLKSVRAALCRGRALKCSRCGRPGATIGCRVDRCPRTYHLPCARAENCIFDHRKFLIACTDHRHIFQPQGNHYSMQIRKMKNRKLRLEMRKLSNEACRKDLEAEDKWLENCGEDEEFLKREGKRLHRDLLRVTPVYIGGSYSEKNKTYQGWESVAGLQDVIRCMKEVIILPLLYPEFFDSLGLAPPRGVLLHGYPGTGKTLVVRALIGECARGDKRIAYFARKGADCLGKYVGDAERQLRLLFQVAEKCQPSIIFFDEIDGLAPCRSKQLDQTHNSVISTLLSLMDGLKSRGSVVVIGATNRPDAVDPALRRPGRFDREIYFPLPSVKDRSAILSLQTKNWPNPLSGSALACIANQTAGYAGADLQALCTQAAMIALKRNCPLHEILTSAEKGSSNSIQPPLPTFTVEEKDWVAALACAPPPCSRREAGMAANGVVTAPLPMHLIPGLLQPLCYILISFSFDERIWIPPALFKASKSTKDVVSSALQQMGLPITSWKSHLSELIRKLDIAKEVERNLSCFGLLSSTPTSGSSCPMEIGDDEHDKFFPRGAHVSCSQIHSFASTHIAIGSEKQSGFRVLISGAPKCGQQHLAACLLHQFLGHTEIHKVNLATISQEGRGDTIRGITQIILKCVAIRHCVVYMPRIDLWAVDEDHEDGEGSTCNGTLKPAKHDDAAKHSSQAWDCFVEQLDSLSKSSSLIILATSEIEDHDLPVRIKEFFMTGIMKHTDSVSSEHTIPRFPVLIDGNFDNCLMISSAVTRVSCDLVEQYIHLIHERSHKELIHKREATVLDNSEETDEICHAINSEKILTKSGASLRDSDAQELVDDSKRENVSCKNLENVQYQGSSISRVPSNRITRGSSTLVIATLGCQILQCPQFAELCWVTSKLKEGPCADPSGPWTVWPFNSCIIDSTSTENVTCPLNLNNVKDKENRGVVRGLVAVGLLAYRGVYTSVKEVSSDVRQVLELLVKLISVKIQNGKDRYRFVQLLSQVAYLDDMVNSWAYTFQSLQIDNRNQISAPNHRPMNSGEVDGNHVANSCKLPLHDVFMPNDCDQRYDTVQEFMQTESHEDCATENGECSNPPATENGECSNPPATENGECSNPPETENGECSNPPNYILEESTASDNFLSTASVVASCPCSSSKGEETGRLGNPCASSPPGEDQECPKGESAQPTTRYSPVVADLHKEQTVSPSCGSMGFSEHCDGVGAVNFSTSDQLAMDEQVGHTMPNCKRTENMLPSETLCFYAVCSDCLQCVHVLTQEFLTRSLKSSGRSPALDDIHEIVTTCSLNLLAAIRKYFFSESCYKAEGCCSREQGPQAEAYTSQDADNVPLKRVSENLSQSECTKFAPNECSQHRRDKKVSLTKKDSLDSPPVEPEMNFFCKDGILLPARSPDGVVLHCSFERLSIQSVVEIVSSVKESCVSCHPC